MGRSNRRRMQVEVVDPDAREVCGTACGGDISGVDYTRDQKRSWTVG